MSSTSNLTPDALHSSIVIDSERERSAVFKDIVNRPGFVIVDVVHRDDYITTTLRRSEATEPPRRDEDPFVADWSLDGEETIALYEFDRRGERTGVLGFDVFRPGVIVIELNAHGFYIQVRVRKTPATTPLVPQLVGPPKLMSKRRPKPKQRRMPVVSSTEETTSSSSSSASTPATTMSKRKLASASMNSRRAKTLNREPTLASVAAAAAKRSKLGEDRMV